MKPNNFIDFDAETFMSENNIAYAEQVSNVGSDWIGVETCPMCGAGNFHFAINKESKLGSCWVCAENCSPPKMIMLMLDTDWSTSYKILNKYSEKVIQHMPRKNADLVKYPSDIMDLNKSGKAYLKKRMFNPETIEKEYGVKQTGPVSYLKAGGLKIDFRFRLMIPMYMNHELISYTARAIGKNETRYQNPNIEACKITPSSAVYNIDSVKNKCIIVEGVTDVWRMGKEVVSLQGVKYTPKQVRFLAEKRLEKTFVMYDPNAEKEALKLANSLSGLCGEINIVTLQTKCDPAELSDFEALKIKHQLLGNI